MIGTPYLFQLRNRQSSSDMDLAHHVPSCPEMNKLEVDAVFFIYARTRGLVYHGYQLMADKR